MRAFTSAQNRQSPIFTETINFNKNYYNQVYSGGKLCLVHYNSLANLDGDRIGVQI